MPCAGFHSNTEGKNLPHGREFSHHYFPCSRMLKTSSDVTETCDKLFLKPGMSQHDSSLGCRAGGMWPGKDKNNLNIQESKNYSGFNPAFSLFLKGIKPTFSSLCSLLYSSYCLINCNFGLRPGCSLRFVKGAATTGRFSLGVLIKGSSRSGVLLMKEGISCCSSDLQPTP